MSGRIESTFPTMPEEEWRVVHSYSAEQAVSDGVLVEVDPELYEEAGYRWPVRITQGVASLVSPTEEEESRGQSLEGRLWDVLWMARVAILNADSDEHIAPFDVMLGGKTATLWACVDTTSGPAIHIIKPEEY